MKSSDQIKGNIKSLAKKKGLKPQEVFQMYFFESVLKRLEKSPYRETFIIKGGLLISSANARRTNRRGSVSSGSLLSLEGATAPGR